MGYAKNLNQQVLITVLIIIQPINQITEVKQVLQITKIQYEPYSLILTKFYIQKYGVQKIFRRHNKFLKTKKILKIILIKIIYKISQTNFSNKEQPSIIIQEFNHNIVNKNLILIKMIKGILKCGHVYLYLMLKMHLLQELINCQFIV